MSNNIDLRKLKKLNFIYEPILHNFDEIKELSKNIPLTFKRRGIDTRWEAQRKYLNKLLRFNKKSLLLTKDIKGFLSFTERWDDSTIVSVINETNLRAVLLSLRLFIGNQEYSYKKMVEIYDALDTTDDKKKIIRYLVGIIEIQMKSYHPLYETFNIDNPKFTNWDVMETFIFGESAHENNPKLIKRIEEWEKDFVQKSFYQTIFFQNLWTFINLIRIIGELNNHVINNFRKTIEPNKQVVDLIQLPDDFFNDILKLLEK